MQKNDTRVLNPKQQVQKNLSVPETDFLAQHESVNKDTGEITQGSMVDDIAESAESTYAVNSNAGGLTAPEAFRRMKEAKDGELQALNGEYWSPKPNEVLFAEFKGMTKMRNNKGELIDAVSLVDEHGKPMINASAILTQGLGRLTSLPAYVKITNNGKKQNGNKQYYDDFKIEVFPGSVS